jgi:hypothetical protein
MRVALPLVSIALTAALVACGGGSDKPLTLEQYFEKIDTLTQELRDKETPILDTLGTSDEVGRLKGALGLYPDAVEEYLSGLQDITPPAEATEAHANAVTASEQFLETLNQAVEDTRNAATVDNFFAAADAVSISVSSESMTVSCAGLQQVADAQNVDIDLSCPAGIGGEETPAPAGSPTPGG